LRGHPSLPFFFTRHNLVNGNIRAVFPCVLMSKPPPLRKREPLPSFFPVTIEMGIFFLGFLSSSSERLVFHRVSLGLLSRPVLLCRRGGMTVESVGFCFYQHGHSLLSFLSLHPLLSLLISLRVGRRSSILLQRNLHLVATLLPL